MRNSSSKLQSLQDKIRRIESQIANSGEGKAIRTIEQAIESIDSYMDVMDREDLTSAIEVNADKISKQVWKLEHGSHSVQNDSMVSDRPLELSSDDFHDLNASIDSMLSVPSVQMPKPMPTPQPKYSINQNSPGETKIMQLQQQLSSTEKQLQRLENQLIMESQQQSVRWSPVNSRTSSEDMEANMFQNGNSRELSFAPDIQFQQRFKSMIRPNGGMVSPKRVTNGKIRPNGGMVSPKRATNGMISPNGTFPKKSRSSKKARSSTTSSKKSTRPIPVPVKEAPLIFSPPVKSKKPQYESPYQYFQRNYVGPTTPFYARSLTPVRVDYEPEQKKRQNETKPPSSRKKVKEKYHHFISPEQMIKGTRYSSPQGFIKRLYELSPRSQTPPLRSRRSQRMYINTEKGFMSPVKRSLESSFGQQVCLKTPSTMRKKPNERANHSRFKDPEPTPGPASYDPDRSREFLENHKFRPTFGTKKRKMGPTPKDDGPGPGQYDKTDFHTSKRSFRATIGNSNRPYVFGTSPSHITW